MPADVHPDDELDATVQRADLDELVRLIDRRTELRDWNGLVRTRRSCIAALDTGRQLWPAATLAEYRLALWAPDEWCAMVMEEDAGRFTPGPLSEVAAVHHHGKVLARTWLLDLSTHTLRMSEVFEVKTFRQRIAAISCQ